MAKKFRYKHILSSIEDKRPDTLYNGEIAVNQFSGKEKLFIKNSGMELVEFIPTHTIEDKIDAAISGKVDTEEYENDTKVITSALTDLDGRKLDASAYTPTDLSNYYTKSETSGKTEISNALGAKSNANHNHDARYYQKTETSGATEISTALATKVDSEEYENDTKVIASALADLDKRINDLQTIIQNLQNNS